MLHSPRVIDPAAPPGAEALDPLIAGVLGALQGVTEFLPVSSSGHLCLAQAWFGIDAQVAGHTFNIVVHAGTLLAVIWTYRADLFALARGLVSPTRHRTEMGLLLALAVGTLPLGLVLLPGIEPLLHRMEGSPRAVGVALVATAGILLLASRRYQERADGRIGPGQAAIVGLCQVLAVMPGISRSGTTIAAGLLVGLPRDQAARFSFLLSIPAILGATAKELLGLRSAPPNDAQVTALAVGFATSLVVGLVSLHWLLGLVHRGRLAIFVPYLLAVGAIAIALG